MAAAEPGPEHGISIHLDELLAERGMTLTQLSERVGVTIVNLSILKNGRVRAIRFSTLSRLCQVLDCQPGDILSHAIDLIHFEDLPMQLNEDVLTRAFESCFLTTETDD